MENLFPKIGSSKTLSQEIECKIEELIITKKIIPGQKLPTEKELCEMFAVSRTALREALQMLSARDLITIRKGSGMYVNEFNHHNATKSLRFYLDFKFNKEYMLHVVNVRHLFEPLIARLAARNRNQEDLEYLLANIEKLKVTDDVAEESILDRNFHSRIAEATANPVISLMVDPIYRLMPRIKALIYAEVDAAKGSAVEYHQKIYEAIRDHDEDGAFEIVSKHLDIALQHTSMVSESLTDKS